MASKSSAVDNKIESFIEIDGNQFSVNDITEKIKDAYKNEGHRTTAIKSLKIYFNVAERRAYYVINDKPEDKFVEF
ncbi:MAG TPA: hypothetical protein DCX21_02570 [Eubacterium sp.]|nr:DUF6465 family protein [Lachnospiraceae bacterium]HAZ90836.1 hypothetical protein [Eubacterium sp.]